ncbi:MAG: DSD1 family PLP-dependent enzyme [Dehalococcoidia bacterium]
MKVRDIPTPALVVDVAAMERNIRTMADFFATGNTKLRPHFKAHKTPAIARRQLAAGSCTGLTVATVGEAELCADEAICDDILIANQVLGPGKAERVARLAQRITIKVAIDSDATLDDIARAAQAEGGEVGVVVDINVGMPRCGIEHGEPALRLAKRAADMSGVRFAGLMGYEGHVVGLPERSEREPRARKAMERLTETLALVRSAGLPCDLVSAGGTGTYDITGRIEGITEIQAGSYVLMDTAYAKLGLPFEQALSLHTTVLSRPRAEQCATDGGLKASSVDHGNPDVKGIEGASVLFLSDEHATITLPADSAVAPGDRLELWPSHVDPTINQHDVLFAVEGDDVVDIWPVTARGYREHRMLLEGR